MMKTGEPELLQCMRTQMLGNRTLSTPPQATTTGRQGLFTKLNTGTVTATHYRQDQYTELGELFVVYVLPERSLRRLLPAHNRPA